MAALSIMETLRRRLASCALALTVLQAALLFAAPPADGVGPAVSIAGVAGFGTLSNAPTARVNTLIQIAAV